MLGQGDRHLAASPLQPEFQNAPGLDGPAGGLLLGLGHQLPLLWFGVQLYDVVFIKPYLCRQIALGSSPVFAMLGTLLAPSVTDCLGELTHFRSHFSASFDVLTIPAPQPHFFPSLGAPWEADRGQVCCNTRWSIIFRCEHVPSNSARSFTWAYTTFEGSQ